MRRQWVRDRLKELGKSAKGLAQAMDWPEPRITGLVDGNVKRIPAEKLPGMAAYLELDVEQIARLEAAPRAAAATITQPRKAAERLVGRLPALPSSPAPGYVYVHSIGQATAEAALPFRPEEWLGEPILMPARLIEDELHGSGQDFLAFEVGGEAMEPQIRPGDTVLADRRSRDGSQAGTYLYWDGRALDVRVIQRMLGGVPTKPRLKMMPLNARFSSDEVPADQIEILGRIVWHGRRM